MLNPALLSGAPGWVLSPQVAVDIDFANNMAWVKGAGPRSPSDLIATVRASQETSLLPTSASGAAYLTFANNVLPISPAIGLQSYKLATNLLLNSTAPATQTTASLGTGVYTLWVNGAGSATPSGATATITGAAAASNGAPNTFTVTVAGTVTVTKSGALNAFQLEAGSFGTPLIVTAGATSSRIANATTFNSSVPTATGTYVFSMGPVGWGGDGIDHTLLAFASGSSTPGIARYSGGTLQLNDGVGYRTSQAYTNGAAFKYAVAFGSTTINSSLNGGAVSAYSSYTGTITGIGTPMLGGTGAAIWNGTIKRLTIYSEQLSNGQLQALTT